MFYGQEYIIGKLFYNRKKKILWEKIIALLQSVFIGYTFYPRERR